MSDVKAARKDLQKNMDRGLSTAAHLADALGTENKRAQAWNRSRLDTLIPQWVEALAELLDRVEAAQAPAIVDEDDDQDDQDEEPDL